MTSELDPERWMVRRKEMGASDGFKSTIRCLMSLAWAEIGYCVGSQGGGICGCGASAVKHPTGSWPSIELPEFEHLVLQRAQMIQCSDQKQCQESSISPRIFFSFSPTAQANKTIALA